MSEAIPTSHSPDLALLNSLLTHGLCLTHLSAAANKDLSTLDILAWSTQPHIAAHLAALRQLANTAASLRLARARFDAIDALARLTSHQDPTTQRLAATTLLRTTRRRATAHHSHAAAQAAEIASPTPIALQAQGLIGRSRGWSAGSASDRSDTPGIAATIVPYPEGVLGASFNAEHPDDQTAPRDAIPPARSSPQSAPPTQRTPESLLAELEALTRQLSDEGAALDEELDDLDDADLDTDDPDDDPHSGSDIRHPTSDIPDLPPLTDQERAEGELALEFFQSLKVPLSHPDIIDALAQGRLHDLPQIAGTIRASRAPP
jgi:hypothetical protein